MSKKQNKNKNNNNNDNNQGKKKEEKKITPTTVVLKVDMHCDGCASKIVRCVRGFQGVESLTADGDAGKLTVTGIVDPVKLRDKLAAKTKKNVELISPLPNKKDKENQNQNQNNKKSEEKKPKELPVTTAVLKVALHCQGCMERIKKIALKTKGVYEVAIDEEKETVTVKGAMDAKAVVANLMKKLKRKVEVVQPKKEKEGGGEKGDGGKKKQKGEEEEGGGKGKPEHQKQNKMVDWAPVYGYGPYWYGGDGDHHYMGPLHAPQIFSDENPNACSVM
ncbi:heavy metal-associated isoprenylated plant protein 3-like isoform X2 [Lotus japonicus]|uniref:heavy metal-associated isoprenylated plant protein 3-like isoform X2 n=1 Tax=Lotus japonicus TaxID=34305 RepID=UPI00258BB406|nr:heavy metal-associated isoprenylated plant protein 3-like isoform X2 [Lotus japonicus]